MLIALRIASSTYHGTLRGVPRLVDALRRHRGSATFLFSLGPDRTGRLAGRLLQAGGIAGTAKPSALDRFGPTALLYGTALPAPDIGRRCATIMTATRDAGLECAIQSWDTASWLMHAEQAPAGWTAEALQRAHERFIEVFGEAAAGHGAAGWQMNHHALRLTQRLGFRWSSDCRGSHPFMPVWNGEVVHCPQLPTTLPTLDELIGLDNVTPENVHEHLLGLTANPRQHHVFTLHAELEGLKFSTAFESLLAGWRDQGYELVSLGEFAGSLDRDRLPRHEIIRGEIPGRSGTLMLQGEEYLSTWKEAA